ncbi:MAG: glycoside hydrolase family 43 protein [Pseudomonadota bacterium]
MTTIQNPILPGFNPDPSILRVGDDYYIATSTFEWFPGVAIHHSRDLVHWRLLTFPLTRASQLDMIGNPDSGGIWAPCLSYANGMFYLIYTDIKSLTGTYKDGRNYLVTASAIEGPWSEPSYMNSSGFDASLFHDDDGRSYLLNMLWDHRSNKNKFAGIVLQEYSDSEKKLVGPISNIYAGTELGITEGPHIYKRDGWYYLLTAEGGTFYEHAVTLARSRSLTGPYQTGPKNPVLTAWHAAPDRLQRTGHASLVETQNGEWFMAHLCSRPLEWQAPATQPEKAYTQLHSNLGRETGLQRCVWTDDGWLELAHGDNLPLSVIPAPDLPPYPFAEISECDDFDSPTLALSFNSLRRPVDESWASLKVRPGFLRLYGGESLNSLHRQSLLARRQQAFRCEAETVLEFAPETMQQAAGLVAYYSTRNNAYLRVSHDGQLGKVIDLALTDDAYYEELLTAPIPLGEGRIGLKVVFDLHSYRFFYRVDQDNWQAIGPALDSAKLSDEYATNWGRGQATSFGFTGNFIGICCQDLSGVAHPADFDSFTYREHK